MSQPLDHTTSPPDRSVKVPHLVFGLLFLGVAALWALGASGAIPGDRLVYLGPAVLILAGVLGLAASLASGRNRRRRLEPSSPPLDQSPTTYETYQTYDLPPEHDDTTEELR